MGDMTNDQRQEYDALLANPIFFPDEFKTWVQDFIATNIPMIPFSHIFGSKINLARSGDFIATSESTTSATYTDLATVGPQLTNLADGTYLIMFGNKTRQLAAVSVNGATPTDDNAIYGVEASPSTARMFIQSLKNNNQITVKVQYKNGTHALRWLTVVRLGAEGEARTGNVRWESSVVTLDITRKQYD